MFKTVISLSFMFSYKDRETVITCISLESPIRGNLLCVAYEISGETCSGQCERDAQSREILENLSSSMGKYVL